jgi:hypothetical protein
MPEGWEIFVQALGVIAMGFSVLSFQGKTSGRILVMQVLGNCFWIIHLFLLNAYTGAWLNILALLRNGTYYFIGKKETDKTTYVAAGFCALSIVVSLITYQNWMSLLPMIGTAVQAFSFSAKDANKMRLFTLMGSPFWLSYHILSGSIPGAATELFAIVSMIVGMVRYRNKVEIVTSEQE